MKPTPDLKPDTTHHSESGLAPLVIGLFFALLCIGSFVIAVMVSR